MALKFNILTMYSQKETRQEHHPDYQLWQPLAYYSLQKSVV